MSRRKPKYAGVGAKCSVLLRFLHPQKMVKDKFPNAKHQDRLEDLVAIEQKDVVVNRKVQVCVVFRSDQFPDKTLHACRRYVKVLDEGDPSHYFDVPQ